MTQNLANVLSKRRVASCPFHQMQAVPLPCQALLFRPLPCPSLTCFSAPAALGRAPSALPAEPTPQQRVPEALPGLWGQAVIICLVEHRSPRGWRVTVPRAACSCEGQLVRPYKIFTGVPIVAQWKWIQPGTMRLRVRSLALLSGLRIRPCPVLWCRSQMRLGPGVAVALA